MKNSEEIFLDELKEEFIEKLQKDIQSMNIAFEEGRYGDISRTAHDIKGTIGIFGYYDGTQLALNLQLAAEAGNELKIRDSFDAFVSYRRGQKILH